MGDPLAFSKNPFFSRIPPLPLSKFLRGSCQKDRRYGEFYGSSNYVPAPTPWSMLERAIENQGKPIESQDELGSFERELNSFASNPKTSTEFA